MDVNTVVVGGGIAGLAAADRIAEKLGPGSLLLLEAAPRLGGKISTIKTDGFVIEGGPDCFLASKPGGIELCRRLGIDHRIVGTSPTNRRSYVRRARRLHELPDGISGLVPSRLLPLMRTSLLSVPGRLRAALELFVPPRRGGNEETIAAFASRRFGREAYDWLIEPLLGGIYAGDGGSLSLDATFPQLRQVESQHGGVLRAMLRRRTNGERNHAGPGFVTLRGGLAEIVEALASRLAGRWRTGTAAVSARRDGSRWVVRLDDGTLVTCDNLIVATPSFAAADLIGETDAALADELRAIPFTGTVTVTVGLRREAVPRPLDGYGYVSPRAEGGDIVACTWTSNKFPTRSPQDRVLLRYFIGRSGRADATAADDAALKALVREELAAMHGIREEPSLWRIFRWPRGMPQYTLGHGSRVSRIERRAAALPGFALAGASYRGVGIPDCITSGWKAADQVATRATAGRV
ncbi:MAG TPA: protoporphyrinogen oxidase [Gemmatimonadales bacterium]|nr:protoporphyrinogen oxidase [Gemmatimonadales bacterium]